MNNETLQTPEFQNEICSVQEASIVLYQFLSLPNIKTEEGNMLLDRLLKSDYSKLLIIFLNNEIGDSNLSEIKSIIIPLAKVIKASKQFQIPDRQAYQMYLDSAQYIVVKINQNQ